MRVVSIQTTVIGVYIPFINSNDPYGAGIVKFAGIGA